MQNGVILGNTNNATTGVLITSLKPIDISIETNMSILICAVGIHSFGMKINNLEFNASHASMIF